MATYYFRNTGSTAWGTATNWSTTDGGAGDGAVPTNADDVFFTSNSGNCTLNTSSRVCKSIDFTGYTGTFGFATLGLTVSGNVTLNNSGMSMTFTGSNGFTVNATSSITTNGYVINVPFTFSGTFTATLVDTFNTSGSLNLQNGGSSTATFTTSNINASGNCVIGGNGGVATGTITVNVTGSGVNWGSTSVTSNWRLPVVFNSAGTITVVQGTSLVIGTGGVLTYTAGTINWGTTTLTLNGDCTLNLAGTIPYAISISGTRTITLTSLLTLSEKLIYALGSTVTFAGTAGWTTATFDIQTSSNVNHILKAGLTYTITTNFISIATTNANKDTIKSDSAGVQAILTLNYGATQSVGFTNATDIDSSLGQTIYTANGILSNATNWNTLSASSLNTKTSIFIN